MSSIFPYNQPLPAVLPSQTAPDFQVRTNQVVRLFLQLLGSTSFADETEIKTKSKWDTLIAQTDDTKIIYTPLFSESVISESSPLKSGKDSNETINGIPDYFGEGVTDFNAAFRSKDAASMTSFMNLTQFSLANGAGKTSLGVYMINNDGHIFCKSDFSPIPIYNLARRMRSSAGLNSADLIRFGFDLAPGWDKDYTVVVPNFDPRAY